MSKALTGFLRYPDDVLDASQLLRCAGLAATHARAGVSNWASYDRNLDKSPGYDLKIPTDLANAIRGRRGRRGHGARTAPAQL